MDQFFLILLNALVYGLLLFMLSSGLTLIVGMMGVLNFAHASFYMLGAYVAFSISTLLNFWAGLIIAPLIVGVLGAAVEHYGLRTVHKHGHLAELLFTFGLSMVIGEIIQLIWGRWPVAYRVPASLDFPLFSIGGTAYPAYRIFMMGISLLMFVVLYAALARTRLGLVVRAALTHPDMVGMLGHNVPRVFTMVFGGGCALAGLAGVIAGNAYQTDPSMALSLGAIVFAVVVMGGLGSISGALLASLIIGLVQTISIGLDMKLYVALGHLGLHVDPAGWLGDVWDISIDRAAPVVPFLLLVIILAVNPKGLAGSRSA